MTDEREPQAELPLEIVPEAPTPEPEPQPEGVDMEALAKRAAELTVETLMNAAQTNAPEAQTQAYQSGSPMEAAIRELHQRANDPTHPLHADALIHLDTLRSRGQEEEWNALGCPPGHPARSLFASSPMAFSGKPRHAYTQWELQEARRTQAQAANNDAARAKAKEDQEKEAAKRVRDSAPDMPSRNVQPTPRAGKDSYDTVEDYRRAAALDPTLDDRYDRGEITIRDY